MTTTNMISSSAVSTAAHNCRQQHSNASEKASASSGTAADPSTGGYAYVMLVINECVAAQKNILARMSEQQASAIASQFEQAKKMYQMSCDAADKSREAAFSNAVTRAVTGGVAMAGAVPGMAFTNEGMVQLGHATSSLGQAVSAGGVGISEAATAGTSADAAKENARVSTVESAMQNQYRNLQDQARELVSQSIQAILNVAGMQEKALQAWQPVMTR